MYGNGMSDATDMEIKKALVTISVEEALLEIGRPVLDAVAHSLYVNYTCFIPDCLAHPEYLRQVLQELYGNGCANIIKSIHKHLDEYAGMQQIEEFLIAINPITIHSYQPR